MTPQNSIFANIKVETFEKQMTKRFEHHSCGENTLVIDVYTHD